MVYVALQVLLCPGIDLGNSIRSYNQIPEWPEQDSTFIFLENKINITSLNDLPEWILVRVNNDMHYTWYNEIYCKKHHDLLAAGDM